MAYSIPHREECLRNVINTRMPDSEKRWVAHIYVDEYITKAPTEENFNQVADVLISMNTFNRYDILDCIVGQTSPPQCNTTDPNVNCNITFPPVDPSKLFPGGTGKYCRCDPFLNVDPDHVAQGSNNIDIFNKEWVKCMFDGLPITQDKYYTPTGKSNDCVFIAPEFRPIACFEALVGNVTECGD